MKDFILGIYKLISSIILWLPFKYARLIFCKVVLRKTGRHCYFSRNIDIRFPHQIEIGSNCIVNKRTLLDGRRGLKIGNNVDIAQDVRIWTLSHNPDSDWHEEKGGMVIIEDYAWICAGATILPNVKIGCGAVVAANAVVTKDVPPLCIVGGIPAQKLGERKSKLLYTLRYSPWFDTT